MLFANRFYFQISSDRLTTIRFRRASDHDPAEGHITRGVDFPVHQPGRHVQEVSRAHRDGMLSVVTPPHIGFAFKNIHDSILRAMVMDPSLCSGLDKKRPAP